MSKPLSIGVIATRTGLGIHTLRYYERIGLIGPITKESGKRNYSEKDLEWIQFLVCLRHTRMPLIYMKQIAALRQRGEDSSKQKLSLFLKQREAIVAQVKDLQDLLMILDRKITRQRQQVQKERPLEEVSR